MAKKDIAKPVGKALEKISEIISEKIGEFIGKKELTPEDIKNISETLKKTEGTLPSKTEKILRSKLPPKTQRELLKKVDDIYEALKKSKESAIERLFKDYTTRQELKKAIPPAVAEAIEAEQKAGKTQYYLSRPLGKTITGESVPISKKAAKEMPEELKNLIEGMIEESATVDDAVEYSIRTLTVPEAEEIEMVKRNFITKEMSNEEKINAKYLLTKMYKDKIEAPFLKRKAEIEKMDIPDDKKISLIKEEENKYTKSLQDIEEKANELLKNVINRRREWFDSIKGKTLLKESGDKIEYEISPEKLLQNVKENPPEFETPITWVEVDTSGRYERPITNILRIDDPIKNKIVEQTIDLMPNYLAEAGAITYKDALEVMDTYYQKLDDTIADIYKSAFRNNINALMGLEKESMENIAKKLNMEKNELIQNFINNSVKEIRDDLSKYTSAAVEPEDILKTFMRLPADIKVMEAKDIGMSVNRRQLENNLRNLAENGVEIKTLRHTPMTKTVIKETGEEFRVMGASEEEIIKIRKDNIKTYGQAAKNIGRALNFISGYDIAYETKVPLSIDNIYVKKIGNKFEYLFKNFTADGEKTAKSYDVSKYTGIDNDLTVSDLEALKDTGRGGFIIEVFNEKSMTEQEIFHLERNKMYAASDELKGKILEGLKNNNIKYQKLAEEQFPLGSYKIDTSDPETVGYIEKIIDEYGNRMKNIVLSAKNKMKGRMFIEENFASFIKFIKKQALMSFTKTKTNIENIDHLAKVMTQIIDDIRKENMTYALKMFKIVGKMEGNVILGEIEEQSNLMLKNILQVINPTRSPIVRSEEKLTVKMPKNIINSIEDNSYRLLFNEMINRDPEAAAKVVSVVGLFGYTLNKALDSVGIAYELARPSVQNLQSRVPFLIGARMVKETSHPFYAGLSAMAKVVEGRHLPKGMIAGEFKLESKALQELNKNLFKAIADTLNIKYTEEIANNMAKLDAVKTFDIIYQKFINSAVKLAREGKLKDKNTEEALIETLKEVYRSVPIIISPIIYWILTDYSRKKEYIK